jgi:hypothetical protein
MSNANGSGFGVLVLIILVACYFIPTVVAALRGKLGTGGVFFVNLLLGWTVVGWFVSFIWACSGRTESDAATEARRHADMMAMLAASAGTKQQQE